ncbi:MAG: DNA-3-methyladenine glycosylase I [Pseudomonadota bacterium]
MRKFQAVYDDAAAFRGSEDALETALGHSETKSPEVLAAIPDDRWLSMMTRCVFQAGFSWKVIDSKWPGFEEAFEGFPVGRWALAPDEDLDRLASDKRIVRNAQKIRTVRDNAVFLADLAREKGSAGAVFAEWPAADFIGLLDLLKKRGSRLGGTSAQYFLRFMGRDSLILSRDVTAALIREGVIDKEPTSKAALKAVQAAFNTWMGESGRSMTEVSRVLAMSVGPSGQPTPH